MPGIQVWYPSGLSGEGGVGSRSPRVIEGREDVVDVQPVTSPTVLNTAYQEVMLWNGQFGNETGVVNVGIDPDRHFTEGTQGKRTT